MSTGVPEGFSVAARRDGSTVTLVIAGELDLHSAKILDQRLAEVSDAAVVEVHAGAVSFVDSAGLRSLLVARQTAADRGAVCRLVAMSDQLARVVEIAGVAALLGDDRSPDAGDAPTTGDGPPSD